jgi:type VI secretion system secreted protein Hcp
MDGGPSEDSAILSFSWGETNTGAPIGGGGGAGKVSMQDVVFTKAPDALTPKLLEWTASGRHVKTVIFTLPYPKDPKDPKAGVRRTVRLEDVLVTAAQIGGLGAPESYALSFLKILVQDYDADGKALPPFSWDVMRSAP